MIPHLYTEDDRVDRKRFVFLKTFIIKFLPYSLFLLF